LHRRSSLLLFRNFSSRDRFAYPGLHAPSLSFGLQY
jgi:hypothetical protein